MTLISTALETDGPEVLAERLMQGDRRALARAITLVESRRPEHRAAAEALLERVLPRTGKSVRVGISGVPGVGKSTFIESFGLEVIDRGHKIAVLAIDPSSPRSGGSILGDKTRMAELSVRPEAFIRPSPSGGTLGGVARRTREVMLLAEASGFDVVLVETVGVGQSETAVADMVDLFMLLLVPGGGDDLQGIKKGIVELADMIVVNKADGDLEKAANRAAMDYQNALHLLRPTSPHWSPSVLKASALTRKGLDAVWETVETYRETMGRAGEIDARRAAQARAWMWSEVSESLMTALERHPAVRDILKTQEKRVSAGETTPSLAAKQLLSAFLDG